MHTVRALVIAIIGYTIHTLSYIYINDIETEHENLQRMHAARKHTYTHSQVHENRYM